MTERFDAVVIGAGIVGLSSALALARRNLRVALIEQHAIGHAKGSSHGSTRITRTSYADPVYAALMRVANREDWPALERDAGEVLSTPMPGVFFGPPRGAFEDYANQAGAEFALLDRGEASRRFPLFRFEDRALVDRSAGVIHADATFRATHRLLAAHGVERFESVRVENIAVGDPIVVRTTGRDIIADRMIVAAGPWTSRLLPALAGRLAPRRQDVGYFRLPRPVQEVFVHLGMTAASMHYALPGAVPSTTLLKAALHRVDGVVDDPKHGREVDPRAIASVGAFLEQVLTVPAVLERAETCMYTCTETEDYVLDLAAPNVAVGAGFSGHGFKLAPLCGRILADLICEGRSIDLFERERAKFRATLSA